MMGESISIIVNRSEIENILGQAFTDEEWVVVKEELEDALDYYLWDEIPRIVKDLPSLMVDSDEDN